MIDGHNGHANGTHHVLEGAAIRIPDDETLTESECVDCSSPGPAQPAGRKWLCIACAQARVNAIAKPQRLCCARLKGTLTGWCTKPDNHDDECDGVRSATPTSTDFGPRGRR